MYDYNIYTVLCGFNNAIVIKYTHLSFILYSCSIQHGSVVNGDTLFDNPLTDSLQLRFTVRIGKVK